LQVKAALKDLGVVQGVGPAGKDGQAKRAKVAFDRLGRVARLGLPRFKLARLAGCSALTAGLFGAAAHVYDSDMLPALRRWVLHALYKGSHFAQLRLLTYTTTLRVIRRRLGEGREDPKRVRIAR
jgi:hypothetical protein